jgi:hypothetical protein
MRVLILAALLALTAAPAAAQDAVDQSLAAHQAFTLGVDSDGMSEGGYFDTLTAGITGRWTPVSPLMENPDDLRERWPATCDVVPVEITLTEPLTISLRRGRADKRLFSFSYVYSGGYQFSAAVNIGEFFDALGINAEDRRSMALTALRSSTSDAMIFRPSPDVLVLAKIGGPIDIYARCPRAVDTSELERVLGELFDAEFKAGRPEVRATFVACATTAFQPVAPDDLAMLIAEKFNPGQEEQERIDAAYPAVKDAARACGEAAEAAERN